MNFEKFLFPPPPLPGNRTSMQLGPPSELAPVIQRYHFYNDLIAGILSITIGSLLIFLVTTRISTPTRLFKKVQAISKCTEILFSASYILTAPVFTSIVMNDTFSGLMIVNTGWQFNFHFSQIFLSAALFLLTEQIFLAPWHYYIRYAQVCRKGAGCIDVSIIVVLNIILQILTSMNLCYAALPTSEDIQLLQEIANKFTLSYSAFLLLSYKKEVDSVADSVDKVLSIISAVSYVSSLVFSIFLMIFFTIKMNLKIRESTNTSSNLLELQRKLNRLLLAQFFSPLIFIQVPFYYSVLGPIVGLSQGLVTDLFPLLFAWSPVFNTFLIFILNSEIRSALIGKQRTSTTSDARRSVGGNQN
ncbi:Serpentine Receptor, class M [Caenorhabditis elegans]|uniref:Serpentine Receptor, class M n=1 Tax=Caenorhabditis elegans TaxID=6239 RepID=Q58A99_CAEEL|nr:Serpentine Receptor, class M [Caenorhabditis elegans]CAI70418.1 Serpentine Receptor, class M [Caenorhabditis elegans]|eukprot:NP_001023942.1 Serpentine Receptor, class M [Caenorhabditis elegans]